MRRSNMPLSEMDEVCIESSGRQTIRRGTVQQAPLKKETRHPGRAARWMAGRRGLDFTNSEPLALAAHSLALAGVAVPFRPEGERFRSSVPAVFVGPVRQQLWHRVHAIGRQSRLSL